MVFHIGDKVIHCTYGLGEVIGIEEKFINGAVTECYVLDVFDTTIWVPINHLDQHSLRKPTPPEDLEKLLQILTSPGEKLLEDRVARKNTLMAQLKDGNLASTCQIIRDLTFFKRSAKLSDLEKTLLERATKSLLVEWSYSLDLPMSQAEQAMSTLLSESVV